MRDVEECKHRERVQRSGPDEFAVCRLLESLSGVADRALCETRRDACEFCCRSFEPAPDALNPAVASLLFQLTRTVIDRGGVAGCNTSKAARLNAWAEQSLLRVGLAEAADSMAPIRNEGPCFHLGESRGTRPCPTCAGTVRLKVYDCHHLLHQTTTLDVCRTCADHDGELSRVGAVARWAVGVTTAPRATPTLETCLDSLAQAGWESPRLFIEPDTEIPARFAHLPRSDRDRPMGEWPNWLLGLNELVLRHPLADAYMMVQDDTIFCRNVRAYLEDCLWPARRVGVISVYCPAPYSRSEPGWHAVPNADGVMGALTFVFPNAAARQMLSHPMIANYRLRAPMRGLCMVDVLVGQWAAALHLPVFYHSPSLAQHIGDTSTLWPGAPNAGKRCADTFVGTDFDARALNGIHATDGLAKQLFEP